MVFLTHSFLPGFLMAIGAFIGFYNDGVQFEKNPSPILAVNYYEENLLEEPEEEVPAVSASNHYAFLNEGVSAEVFYLGFSLAGILVITGIVLIIFAFRSNTLKENNKKMRRKFFLGWAFIFISLCLIACMVYLDSDRRKIPLVFSERTMLKILWEDYKREYLEPDTWRTLDKQRGNVTTSEGQSYTMLRAVWMDDKETFDRSWDWTKDNLRRETDNLFAWLFGERSDGTYGVIDEFGGNNTASDADVDIALSLLFAFSRWQEEKYLEEALKIIPDIWEHEVVMIEGRPYLASNNIEKSAQTRGVVLNPSYFAPYAYRIFASVDKSRDWETLVETSYDVLEKSLSENSAQDRVSLLPPDWVEIDRTTGELLKPRNPNLTLNYGYDAMRVPWRLALDYEWYGEPRAKEILSRFEFLENEWEKRGLLYSVYSAQGQSIGEYESPAMYGGSLGYFLINNKKVAEEIYTKKLLVLYDPDTESWRGNLSYYDDNLAWFGLALYNRALTNLHILNFR